MTNKKVYVTMTDKFMSGWGHADNKINKLVFECDSLQEAHVVADNAEAREDMKHININYTKPYYSPSRYLAHFKTKEEYSAWYQPNYFSKGNN